MERNERREERGARREEKTGERGARREERCDLPKLNPLFGDNL